MSGVRIHTSETFVSSNNLVRNFTLPHLKAFTTYNVTVNAMYISGDREASIPLMPITERKVASENCFGLHYFCILSPAGVPDAPVIRVVMDMLTWDAINANGGDITRYRLYISR